MLYFIYGTNIKKRKNIREMIFKKIKKDFNTFLFAKKIDKTNFEELKNYILEQSIFGEKLLIEIEDLLTLESTREYLYKNIKNLIESENIFILDEPFAANASIQKVINEIDKNKKTSQSQFSESFDAIEIKIKEDLEPSKFCDFIEMRDKKNAFIEWKKIYNKWGNDEEQFLHGALWFRWKNIWQAKLNNKTSTYDFFSKSSRPIKYNLEELERFGKEISLLSMKSNNGEIDLMKEIKKFLLKM